MNALDPLLARKREILLLTVKQGCGRIAAIDRILL